MVLPILWAMVAKNLGHLQRWSGHGAAPFTRYGWIDIQGTHQLPDQPVGDVRVTQGGADGTVAQEDLQDADIGAGFQQMRGKAVTQGVHGDPLGKTRLPNDSSQDRLTDVVQMGRWGF